MSPIEYRLVVWTLLAARFLVAGFVLPTVQSPRQRNDDFSPCWLWSLAAANHNASSAEDEERRRMDKAQLLQLLAAVPRNTATSRRQTQDILQQVRKLEPSCPTDPAQVLTQSAGTWELLWTAQDASSKTCAPKTKPPERETSIFFSLTLKLFFFASFAHCNMKLKDKDTK